MRPPPMRCDHCDRTRQECRVEPCARAKDLLAYGLWLKRHEAEHDDDMSDLQPFTRTTTYPWGA